MKRNYWMVLVALLVGANVWAQGKSETITKQFAVNNASAEFWFCVCNINGSVEVEAYDGEAVQVVLKKQVNGKTNEDLALGMEEVNLGVLEGTEFVKLFLSSPNHIMEDKADPLQCSWEWNRKSEHKNYWYTLDFTVKVPKGISVKLSTVNKGSVLVKNVEGNVYASNVNGDVTLQNLASDTKASTVNGKLEVNYKSLPKEFGSFNTVNGDIEIRVPESASAIFSFQSQWGEVYSDLEFTAKLAPKVTKAPDGNGVKYKIANSNSYQYGKSGGPTFEFETLNGDVYLRKQ